jgi:hypothetical protein
VSTIPRAQFGDPLLKARSARRLELWQGVVLAPWFVGVAIVGGVGAGVFVHWGLGAGLVAAAVFGSWLWADGQADREWWLLLLQYLRLDPDDTTWVEGLTPLLRSGDERVVLRAGSDAERQLLIFRSTDVSKDSNGNKSRDHHDYTVVLYRDAAPAIHFLSAHEHKARWAKWLGDALRGPTIGGVEEFQVESVALHERFELRSSISDGSRARQIFEPSFILWFAQQGVAFEYEAGDLAVIVDRVLEHAEEYKLLLSRADSIHAAISQKAIAPRA